MIEYQSANGDFVSVPTYLGSVESQSDRLMYSLALRYGISKDLEIFGFGNFYSSTEHTLSANGTASRDDSGFSSCGAGWVYQIHKEDDYPAVLIGGTIDLIDNDELLKKNFYLKSGSVFVSSYYTSDPVVFFLKASYGHNGSHANKTHSLEAGNVFSLTPQIYFAVNPYMSLNWGVRYQYKQKDTYDGNAISTNQSRLGWLFGVSYELNAKSVISADMDKSETSTYSQNTFTLNYSYKF